MERFRGYIASGLIVLVFTFMVTACPRFEDDVFKHKFEYDMRYMTSDTIITKHYSLIFSEDFLEFIEEDIEDSTYLILIKVTENHNSLYERAYIKGAEAKKEITQCIIE